jgi:lon-related putative ATP-dependent protease
MPKSYELKPAELRSLCDPKTFTFKNTSEVEPLDDVIGQERAVQAIDFGLNMKSPGYNIFVTGIEGTGKSTIVQDIVNDYAGALSTPDDWCMVNNFKDEYRPRAIAVPSGKAIAFSKKINKLVEDLKKEIPKAFESELYQERQTEIQKKYSQQQQDIFQQLEQSAKKKQMQINQTRAGFQAVPVINDKQVSPEEFRQLPEKDRSVLEEKINLMQSEIESAVRELNKINQGLRDEVEKLIEETTLFIVKNHFYSLRTPYKGHSDILTYLDEVQEDIVENVDDFLQSEDKPPQAENMWLRGPKDPLQRYKVNVLVDRRFLKGAPVIYETNPTYNNVFGQIEKRAYLGTLSTDFSMVQAGSLLRANGGYLVMEIESVLMNPFVWEGLMRALQNKLLSIEDMSAELGYGSASLRPEPIPLDVKVILLGEYEPFHYLQNYDSKFNKIFKVRADFDYEVKRNKETVQQYARFISRVCQAENLLPFDPDSVAAIVEYGEKYVAHKNKLSIRFGPILGVLKEADYWARKGDANYVSEKFVKRAFNEYRFRYNLYETKIHESYVDGTIMIDVDGEVVGQVNALAVYQIGDISFGRPSRITAETYMGMKGIINIEREAKLSGKTHDKGVLILSGYLGRIFAQNYPLSLSASITFEQSYGGIDGDSASSTELYALISSLADIPIRQALAVTGSVNQKGQIQAIGGVNQKIEGFFDVCEEKGLSGQQGVLIPKANVNNLMLKKEVIDAVKKGDFHIYQVSTVAEGIEILTGVPAGKKNKEGNYAEGTVFGKVQEKLKKYLERSLKMKKEFGGEEDEQTAV